MRDLRYAFRLIRRQPLFAALVIATLTLGIGASTSMFSVVNGVLLKPLPYSDPARLVWMYGSFRGSDSAAVSPPDFVDYRNRNEVFERLGAMAISPASVTVSGSGTPVRMRASRVRHLLTMSSGIPDLFRVPEFWAQVATVRSPVELWKYGTIIHRTTDRPRVYFGGRGRNIPPARTGEYSI